MKSSVIFCFLAAASSIECALIPFGSPTRNDIPQRCVDNSHTPVRCDAQPLPEDRLLAHPDDCELFYYCVSAELPPICRQCPAGLHFNPAKRVCDHPEFAGCSVDASTTSAPAVAAIVPAVALLDPRVPKTDNISENCRLNSPTAVRCERPLPEDNLLPHPDRCELFYYCVAEGLPPICRDCPAGLHFNPAKRVCDRPEEAGCRVAEPVGQEGDDSGDSSSSSNEI